MIKRQIAKKIKDTIRHIPAVAIIGPRQSGKTTLVKALFPDWTYVTLEDGDTLAYVLSDPRGFLDDLDRPTIIDEAQKAPLLFSYLQTKVDSDPDKMGQFILTGSQNFLLMENISQSLAGRIIIYELLPLSLSEISIDVQVKAETLMFKGMYPRLHQNKKLPVNEWYNSYIKTYIERDIRKIKNITDLNRFQIFMKMCAGRTGQLLNLSSLANDCGISHTTAENWISILETSFIVFRLRPHFKHFNKRLVKMPKLYFYDTGLVCALLGVKQEAQIATHYLKGSLFESFIISEIVKTFYNRAEEPGVYFWRDKVGHEIDCLIDSAGTLTPIEIKSGKTVNADYFSNIQYWCALSGNDPGEAWIIYGGDQKQQRKKGCVVGWRYLPELFCLNQN